MAALRKHFKGRLSSHVHDLMMVVCVNEVSDISLAATPRALMMMTCMIFEVWDLILRHARKLMMMRMIIIIGIFCNVACAYEVMNLSFRAFSFTLRVCGKP